MQTLVERRILDRRVIVAASERGDGDVHPIRVGPDDIAARQRETTGRRWAMLDQRHGTRLVRAVAPDAATIGIGDVVVSDDPDLAIAIWAADCAALIFLADDGRRVGAHAGWRGLAAGVVDVAVDALDGRSAIVVAGPTIGPCCYEFGGDELARVAAGVGTEPARLAATTRAGAPALDVPRAIDAALARRGYEVEGHAPCTHCDRRWYSHRRGDRARHAVVAWGEREP